MSLRTSTITAGASVTAALAVGATIRLRRSQRLRSTRLLRTRRFGSNSQSGSDLDDLARRGLTIVELLADYRNDQPTAVPTGTLLTAAQRSSDLAADLARYEAHSVEPRTTEAIDDMRQVALRLGAALDAECARRAGGSAETENETSHLARRVAELDLVARELSSVSAAEL